MPATKSGPPALSVVGPGKVRSARGARETLRENQTEAKRRAAANAPYGRLLLQVGNNCQVLPEGSQRSPPSLSSAGKSRRKTPRCGECTLLAPGSHPSFIVLLSTRIFPIPEALRSRKCVQRGES